jgi:hypothetical protein
MKGKKGRKRQGRKRKSTLQDTVVSKRQARVPGAVAGRGERPRVKFCMGGVSGEHWAVSRHLGLSRRSVVAPGSVVENEGDGGRRKEALCGCH